MVFLPEKSGIYHTLIYLVVVWLIVWDPHTGKCSPLTIRYLTLTLLGCYQVLIRGRVRHLKGLIHPVITCETAVNIGILNGSQRRIGRSDRPLVRRSRCARQRTPAPRSGALC